MSDAPGQRLDSQQGAARSLLIVAGEASGDLHGASLARQLAEQAPGLRLLGVGGDGMQSAGVELLYHYRNLAVVGITEVIAHLGDVRRAMRQLLDAAREHAVDGVVLIDYPDFNMTLARRLRRADPDLPIVYYVSPQVWAWRSGRVRTLARLVRRMLVILPFEAELYRAEGVDVEFVGHPLLDVVPAAEPRQQVAARLGLDADREWIALLPGSRRAEVDRLLPVMLRAAARLGRTRPCSFVVPVAPALDTAVYEAPLRAAAADGTRVSLVHDDRWEAVRHSRAAIVCSGTATLETALVGTPMVVVYRTSWLTYNLAKYLVRVRNIALVNVVAKRRGVPELIQRQVTPEAIVREIEPLLDDGRDRTQALEFLDEVRGLLGDPGASERAARAVLEVVGDAPEVAVARDAASEAGDLP